MAIATDRAAVVRWKGFEVVGQAADGGEALLRVDAGTGEVFVTEAGGKQVLPGPGTRMAAAA